MFRCYIPSLTGLSTLPLIILFPSEFRDAPLAVSAVLRFSDSPATKVRHVPAGAVIGLAASAS